MWMHTKEIVNIICENHPYEYILINKNFELLNCSNGLEKYCSNIIYIDALFDIFELMPELLGMEEALQGLSQGLQEHIFIPYVWRDEHLCINIHVYQGKNIQDSLLILLEDISVMMKSKQISAQVNNENLLLITEIEEKNKQLKYLNEEMQRLVDGEVGKNKEKQHMLELQTRHAQMGELIALITHQWKQPLSVIQTIGTLIKMKHELGTLAPKLLVKKMDNILEQVGYMNQTVHDFQKFFTPSKKRDLFNVKKTIAAVLDLVRMDYALGNIDISVEGDDEVYIDGYANEYKQVMLSILQNAKDAFKSQVNSHKYIHIMVKREKEHTLVSISDNAGGIPKEIKDEIFTQYITTKTQGSGLGLYIAKSVIENNMQGKLWVESSEIGAAFFIEL